MIKEQLQNPRLFLIGIIIVVVLMSFLSVQLKQNSKLDALIPDDGEFNTNEELVRRAFDNGDGLLILFELDTKTELRNAVTDINDPKVTSYLQTLRAVLNESQYIKSISQVQYAKEKNVAKFGLEVRTPNRLGGDKEVKHEIESLMSQVGPPPGIKVQLTGLPLLIDRISSLLIKDNLTTILLTLVFILLFLYWYFRSVRYVIAIILSPIISLIMLSAVMVIFGISITIPLAAVGVLVLGLGVDYGIHIAIHYKYNRLDGQNHRKAMLSTIKELKIPITASFLTTLAGFAALLFGVSPSTQDQGAVLSFAITIIYAVSFVAFPVLLTVLVKNVIPKPNKFFGKIKEGLAKLAIYQFKHSKTILLIFGLITVIMLFGMTKVEFSTSNSNWIPDDDPLSLALREDSYAFGENEAIFIILKSTSGDLRQVETIKDIQRLESDLKQIPNVDSVQSVFSYSSLDSSESFEYLTNQKSSFNEDYTISLIRITSMNPNADENGNSKVLKDIREVTNLHPIYNAETTLFGDLIRFEELSESLQADAAATTIAGLILVLIIASLIYASITVGLVSLIPIVIGLIWAIGLMGYFGVPFTSLSTGIVSLVLGIGIDFSIHLVDGIKRNLKKYGMERSLNETLMNSGTSILLASMTTFIGFIALTFSTLLGTQRLGWSLALAVLSVFIVAIMAVPVIIKLTQVKK